MPEPRDHYPVSRGTGFQAGLPRLPLLLEFYLLPSPYTPLVLLSFFRKISPFDAADCLLLFHAALFALGDEPAFAAHSAQNSAFDDFLAKALEQRILRLAVP